ncbi:D-2-hydroxyacid dehydrogenase [Heliobacterium gestii]|uniref:D-2-hydroxyacid dehydrogenase n=1 Tax=Heliomicrobium gestii TaxID=2699 RepID=A0A845LCD8_HELGE|nr:NAD(P)-dependent oxidoreductase [Heliomicrobium gestii]MBM7868296.1 glycerate dehydrogenase [Heliomicrobium gestii]MZP44487.1 D-2-hydroxyacid dehydrogenase [Heliomicrobium gestii]
MKKTVILNLAKLNYDNKIDLSPISALTAVTAYDDSSPAEIIERLQGQDIAVTKELPVGRDLIEQFPPSVKLICEAGTGFNNIDLAAAREKGITVCNVPGYSTEGVAHLAITFMLNHSASLTRQQIMLREKNFVNFTDHLTVPHVEVNGKTLGVVGGGAIGREVMKVAVALEMNILVYDPMPRDWGNAKIHSASLEDLLRKSDFVTLHCPLTPETRHLINRERLSLMKPSAYLINTSRGPLVKEADLVEALRQSQIAGAALDVHEVEPLSADSPLFNLENAVLTPHIGWQRLESRQRLFALMAGNIEAYLNGAPRNVVS